MRMNLRTARYAAALLSLTGVPAWGAQILGTVRDAEGVPVGGAVVVASGNGASRDANGARHRWVTTSDAAGRFAIADYNLKDCQVTANADATGLGHANCAATDGAAPTSVTITVKPETAVAGGHIVRPLGLARMVDDVVLLQRISSTEDAPEVYGTHMAGDRWKTSLPVGSWAVRAVTPTVASGTVYCVVPMQKKPITLDLVHPRGTNPALARELGAMYEKDQEVRRTFMAAGGDDDETRKPMLEVDAANLARLKQIVRQQGWPDSAMVGSEGMFDFFMLVQHEEDYIPVALPHLRAAADRGEIPWSLLAMMIDRDLTVRKQQQIYGTQMEKSNDGNFVVLPLVDPAHVDVRRAQVGLDPLVEHVAKFAKSLLSAH